MELTPQHELQHLLFQDCSWRNNMFSRASVQVLSPCVSSLTGGFTPGIGGCRIESYTQPDAPAVLLKTLFSEMEQHSKR